MGAQWYWRMAVRALQQIHWYEMLDWLVVYWRRKMAQDGFFLDLDGSLAEGWVSAGGKYD